MERDFGATTPWGGLATWDEWRMRVIIRVWKWDGWVVWWLIWLVPWPFLPTRYWNQPLGNKHDRIKWSDIPCKFPVRIVNFLTCTVFFTESSYFLLLKVSSQTLANIIPLTCDGQGETKALLADFSLTKTSLRRMLSSRPQSRPRTSWNALCGWCLGSLKLRVSQSHFKITNVLPEDSV